MTKDNVSANQLALYAEIAKQHQDSLDTIQSTTVQARKVADSLKRTKRLLLLGMGGSHAVGRVFEPLYRAHGIDAVAVPLSEQLGQPLSIEDKTILVTSQSGESAEVLRWFKEAKPASDTFGLTMTPDSSLSQLAPVLVGSGGREIPFAATRSLSVTAALHAAVLQELGEDLSDLLAVLASPLNLEVEEAVQAFSGVEAIVTSGRQLQGLAEAIALGLTELSRLPCFSLEGGQLRHGPVEMLGKNIGVILFRAADATCDLVTATGVFTTTTDSPLIIFDASDEAPVPGAVTIKCPKAEGLAAFFSLLPSAQRFMVDFAVTRVKEVGVPVRCTKVTTVEY